jgi:hypothetical protein
MNLQFIFHSGERYEDGMLEYWKNGIVGKAIALCKSLKWGRSIVRSESPWRGRPAGGAAGLEERHE